jgi:hypothetical protein
LFSALSGVSSPEPDNAHHFEADPTLWVDWESFSTWHEWFETPKHPSRYVIRAIVCYEMSYSGNVVIEFSNLIFQGVGHRWAKDKACMKKWGVYRGTFSKGRQLLHEAFLKEGIIVRRAPQLHLVGSRRTPKKVTTAGCPGATTKVKIVLWCCITSVEKIMIKQPFNLFV